MAIAYGLTNKENRYALFPLLIILVFGVCSVLASTNGPFSYLTTLYYYFALFPLMTAKCQEQCAAGPEDRKEKR